MVKKALLIGFILILLVAVPLTIYILTTQTTQQKSNANPASILSLVSASGQNSALVGTPFGVNVFVDPSGDPASPNKISFIKIAIQYDGTFFNLANSDISTNVSAATGPFKAILDPAKNSCNGTTCTITFTLSVGPDPKDVITAKTKVATITFHPQANTSTNTSLTFVGGQNQVLSVATTDQPAENVLLHSEPLVVTITGGVNPTPTGSGSPTPTPTTTASASGPVCTSLSVDNSSGNAPFSVLVTANGNSSPTTISKITFNFGDGQTQDITQGSGTSSMTAQVAHIYQNNGTFTATAVVVDSAGASSNPTTCTQTITVGTGSGQTAGGTTAGGANGSSSAQTATAQSPTTGTTKPPVTGPGATILGVGIGGAVLTILGIGLLFGL